MDCTQFPHYIFSLLTYFWRNNSTLWVFVLLFLLKIPTSLIPWMGGWVHETLRHPSPLGESDSSKARNQYNRVEEMKNGGFMYLIWCFFYSSVSFLQMTPIHLPSYLLENVSQRQENRRSVFLPSLYCTHNWYFCHLCLLAKLSMKLICNAWLYFIQNWTVNLLYQKYLY